MTLEEKYELAVETLRIIYDGTFEDVYKCDNCDEEHTDYILDDLIYESLEDVLFILSGVFIFHFSNYDSA